MHHLDSNETSEEKVKWELQVNATCFDQILEAALPEKSSHLIIHPRQDLLDTAGKVKKKKNAHEQPSLMESQFLLHMDTLMLANQQILSYIS